MAGPNHDQPIPRRRPSAPRRLIRQLTDRSSISPFHKYVIFFANFIFLLGGLAVTVVASYVLVKKEKKVVYFVEFLFDPSCLMCLAGSITIVTAFFGSAGALRENTTFIRIYYWLLSILLCVQLVMIVFAFIFYFMEDVATQMNLAPEKLLNDAVLKYREDVDMRNFIDDMQEFLECCGVSNNNTGYQDWNNNRYFNCRGVTNPVGEQCAVPYSCCIKKSGDNINYQCGYNTLLEDLPPAEVSDRIFVNGCLYAIKLVITDNTWIIGGVIIGILIPQAFLICIAKTLYDQIMMQKSKW